MVCQSTSRDGSVGCRAACHAAWRRSWAMPGRPGIGGVPQQAWWLQLRVDEHASPSCCSRLLDARVGAGWMLPEHESKDGSVGCRAAYHAAWRRSWAMPGRPDVGGGGARRPCPAGLPSVEYLSKRGGFSCTSTSTPLQAAAHGFSMHVSGLGGCCQSTTTDGSVGCRAACHAAWRRSWAMHRRPDISGVTQ